MKNGPLIQPVSEQAQVVFLGNSQLDVQREAIAQMKTITQWSNGYLN